MSQTLKNKYQVCEEVGRGRFGIISRVFCPKTQSSFASKSIDKRLLTDQIDRQWLENEPKIMTLLPPNTNIVQIHDMSELMGTPYYVAPEIVMGRAYNEKVDVWSAGVVLYVMLAGVPPFNGETAGEIFETVSRGNLRFPRRVFRSVSGEVKDLLRKMICRDVSKRLSAEQVLRHPWMMNGGLICF